jgi:hypothetical protein
MSSPSVPFTQWPKSRDGKNTSYYKILTCGTHALDVGALRKDVVDGFHKANAGTPRAILYAQPTDRLNVKTSRDRHSIVQDSIQHLE